MLLVLGLHSQRENSLNAESLRPGPAVSRAGLRSAMSQLVLSAWAFHHILRLARQVAGLEGVAEIKAHHLAESIQYRPRMQT